MDDGQKPQEESWNFSVEGTDNVPADDVPNPSPISSTDPISWTGSEFISNQKNASWYTGFTFFVAIVCGLIYLFTRDILSVAFIFIISMLFLVVAARKPRQLTYVLDARGIQVGSRIYHFGDFKSFSVQHHGAIAYVSLMPLHRLHNELSIYYPPDQEDKILNTIASQIPHDQRRENSVDKLAKIIRF